MADNNSLRPEQTYRLVPSGDGGSADTVLLIVPPDIADAKADVLHLLAVARKNLWLLLVLFSVGAAGAYGLSYLIEPLYRASSTVVPLQDNGLGGGSGLASQLGTLGALAGFSLFETSSVKAENLALLESKGLARQFLAENPSCIAELAQRLRTQLPTPGEASAERDIPEELVEYFVRRVRRIESIESKGTLKLSIDWYDRDQAVQMANDYVDMANSVIRSRAISESQRALQYLEKELAATQIMDLRQSIFESIKEHISRSAMARVRHEYAFRVVDRAALPKRASPIKPMRILYGAGGAMLGLLIGLSIGVMRGIRTRS